MNDFTKEELEYIREVLGPYCGDDSAEYDPYSRYLPGLYTKVLDMIDNYSDIQKCAKCNQLREGKYLDAFSDNGHWHDGGIFCGRWL